MNQNVFAAAHGWIEREGRWLLTKRSAITGYMPQKWDIPGGTIEYGESPEGALIREIEEETGLSVMVGKPLFIFNNLTQFPSRQTFQIIYQCKYVAGSVVLNPEEHAEHRWCTLVDTSQLQVISFLDAFLRSLMLRRLHPAHRQRGELRQSSGLTGTEES